MPSKRIAVKRTTKLILNRNPVRIENILKINETNCSHGVIVIPQRCRCFIKTVDVSTQTEDDYEVMSEKTVQSEDDSVQMVEEITPKGADSEEVTKDTAPKERNSQETTKDATQYDFYQKMTPQQRIEFDLLWDMLTHKRGGFHNEGTASVLVARAAPREEAREAPAQQRPTNDTRTHCAVHCRCDLTVSLDMFQFLLK